MKYKTSIPGTPGLLIFAWMIFFGLSIQPVQAAPAAQTPELEIRMRLVNEERTAFPGQYLEFEIIVKNISSITQTNVQIQDKYTPGGLDFDSVKVYSEKVNSEHMDIRRDKGENEFTLDLGDLPPNAEIIIVFKACVKDLITLNKNNITVIENTAEVSTNGNPSGQKEVSLDVVAFSIEKEALGDGVIQAGELTKMTLTVVNNTDVNFEEVEVNDYYQLPSSFTNTLDQTNEKGVTIRTISFDSTDTAQAPIMQDANGNDYVLWQLGQMNAGKTVEIEYTIEFELRPQEMDEKLINNAKVYVVDPDHTNDLLMAQTDFPEELLLEDPPPQIKMKRTIQRLPEAGEIQLGDKIQFTIEIVNEGGAAANVEIIDLFEDGNVFENFESIKGEFHENDSEDNSSVSKSNDTKVTGRRDGSQIIWEIEELPSGKSLILSYDVKIKEGLFAGNQELREEIKLTHTASIKIDGASQNITANETTFTVRKLLKLNVITINDVNGADIEPGDTLRVTIPIENKGAKNELDIKVLVDYDLIENLSFDNLGQGQLDQTKGQITWTPNLIPGENAIIFDLLLPAKIEEMLTFGFNVTISRNETALANTRKSITVEPSAQGKSALSLLGSIPSSQNNFTLIFFLIVAMMVSAFILLALIAKHLATNNELNRHMQELIVMFTIVVIISTLLVLSMVTTIGENAAIGILSGIAGYVLGSRSFRSSEPEVVPGVSRDGGKPAPIVQHSPPIESQSPDKILELAKKSVLEALKEMLADGETLSRDKLMDVGSTDVGKVKEVVDDSIPASGDDVDKANNMTLPDSSEKEPPKEA